MLDGLQHHFYRVVIIMFELCHPEASISLKTNHIINEEVFLQPERPQ